MELNRIKKLLPKDYHKHAERDISLLANSIFVETYSFGFEKELNIKFSSSFWFINKGLTKFYRSQKEHNNFAKTLGSRAMKKKIDYTEKIAKELFNLTNWFYKFTEKNKNLKSFLKNKKEFVDNYRMFFTYHQVIYWTADYIATTFPKNDKGEKIIKILDRVYNYNELVVPDAEKYFKKLKINKFLHDEIGEGYKYFTEKERKNGLGIIFIKGKRMILNWKDSKNLENFIEKRNKKYLGKIKEIKGISAQEGRCIGKVQLIKNFSKLKNIKEGAILVTYQVRPQFNKFVKKAGAIITDEGGILCHASMLSREFKIPCIVGTKIATEVLKTGDRVEINGSKGIIKIIR